MKRRIIMLLACALAMALSACDVWEEVIVDDFETYANVADVGHVASGWTYLDFGPQSVSSGGPYSKFDFTKDDQVVGQTITTGADGILQTLAQEDDVYAINPFSGQPDAVCVGPGGNGTLESSPGGDDQVLIDLITTGANGKCESTAVGDDIQVIPVGQGEPDAVGITAGPNAVLDTDNMPHLWADSVPGYGGVGLAQAITVVRGTRALVKQFPVASGMDYVISMKCRFEQLGQARTSGGIMQWGYDLTGQTSDPTPKGPDASSTGTVIYQSIYNQPHNDKWSDIGQAVREGWVSTYETCTATGSTISIWIMVDDQSWYLQDGFRMTVDDLAISEYTPEPDNEIWNGRLELRAAVRGDAVPAGFYPNEVYPDEVYEGGDDYDNGGLREAGTLKPECSLAQVGHQVFSGNWSAAGGRYSGPLSGSGAGLTFTARDLKDNTTYVLRAKIYETIVNGDYFSYGGLNIGPQGGVFLRCNLRGDLARQADGDTSYGQWPYGFGYYEDTDFQDWSYPYQGRGWWDFEYSIMTGDFQPGVDDERVEISIWGWNGKMRTITYFDDLSLVEQGLDPFIEVSNVSQVASVPPSGEVTITWESDVSSFPLVEYGTTEALGLTTDFQNPEGVNHSMTISGLDPAEDFYYRVCSGQDEYIWGYSRQYRVLAPHSSLVNGDFEGGFYSRIRQTAIETGYNGLCDSTAAPGDVQLIPVGQGVADLLCVSAGGNDVLDTGPLGDDEMVGETITTGPDGVCDTTATGDDKQELAVGEGGDECAPCIGAGGDGVITTLRAGDDRTHEDMRPAGWEFWNYSYGELPGFVTGGGAHIARWANGALFGFAGQEASEWWPGNWVSSKEAGEVHGGDNSFGMWNAVSNSGEVGGACQTVDTVSGVQYTVSAWMRGYDDHAQHLAHEGLENVATQLGVDPLGGSDPTAPSVIWNDKVFYGAGDDVQVIPVGQGDAYTHAVDAGMPWWGGDNVLESTPGGDDTIMTVICPGPDFTLDTAPVGDDQSVAFWFTGYDPAILPGPNGTIESTPAGDDILTDTITTGPDGVCDSVGTDDDMPWLFIGYGQADTICIDAGSDGLLISSPEGTSDDGFGPGNPPTYIITGTDGICQSTAVSNGDATHRFNNTWYQEDLVFTAASDRATVFLSGHIHSGATFGPRNRHCIWFDDVEMSAGFDSVTWEAASAGWNLMSIPIEPFDPEPAAVFADLAACGNTIATNLYRYSKTAGYELYPGGDFTAMQTGRAYWLRLTSVCNNTIAGTLVTGGSMIDLDDGWNMMGMPGATPVLWSGCLITDGVDMKSVEDAGAAGWIQTLIYYYTPGGYMSVKPDGTGDDDSLRPWVGYWFLTYQPGLTLIIP